MKTLPMLAVILAVSTFAGSSKLLADEPNNAPTQQQGIPQDGPPNLDRPLTFDEAKKKGYFRKIQPRTARGYEQRQRALEERRQMFPPENPTVPTYDPRTHELRNGKIVPKSKKHKTSAAPAQNGRTNFNRSLTRRDAQRNRSCYGSSTRCNRWKPQRNRSCYGNTTRCRHGWRTTKQGRKMLPRRKHIIPSLNSGSHRLDIGKIKPKLNSKPRRPNVQPPYQRSSRIPTEIKRLELKSTRPLEINRIGN